MKYASYRVLDHGFIEAQSTDDETAIADSARVSFNTRAHAFTTHKNAKLIKYLYDHKHMTPFEHVRLKLRVKAPVLVWWQWVRHRAASYNLQSGRYTAYTFEFYEPDRWRQQSDTNKQGSHGVIDDNTITQELYRDHLNRCFRLYQDALDRGTGKELARLFLPAFALYHTGIISLDLRNCLAFLKLRTADDAQYEIRQYALALEDIIRDFYPTVYEIYKQNPDK